MYLFYLIFLVADSGESLVEMVSLKSLDVGMPLGCPWDVQVHARYAVLLGDQQLLWKEAIMASRLAQLVAKELLLGPE